MMLKGCAEVGQTLEQQYVWRRVPYFLTKAR